MRKPLILSLLLALPLFAQTADPPATARSIERLETSNDRAFEEVIKNVDDLLWNLKLADVARVEKYNIATSKPRREKNPTAQGAGNMLVMPVYVFTPVNVRGKAPTIVIAHGGVHGDFNTFYLHIVREMIAEGYVVVAPEYRGSTGYGSDLYNQIDYGGTEVDDVHDARDWAAANVSSVDPKRIGIIGWSHGGYQTLM